MASALILGGVLFQDFELPERISWGGQQRLSVHRLPGGVRVIDAMGRDDAQIVWSGMFSGANAAERAQMIDLMRVDGAVWPLVWDSFFYSVVVAVFQADYRRANWIPYRIACTVLRDEAEAMVAVAASLAASGLADLTSANAVGSGADLSGPLDALNAPGATTLGTAAYSTALGSLNTATAQIAASVTSSGEVMAASSIGSAADLTQIVGTAGQLASLTNAQGFVQRAQVNLVNAST
jgi:hypothetical protein